MGYGWRIVRGSRADDADAADLGAAFAPCQGDPSSDQPHDAARPYTVHYRRSCEPEWICMDEKRRKPENVSAMPIGLPCSRGKRLASRVCTRERVRVYTRICMCMCLCVYIVYMYAIRNAEKLQSGTPQALNRAPTCFLSQALCQFRRNYVNCLRSP